MQLDAQRTSQKKKLTQAACAKYLGIPLRIHQSYDADASKVGSIKYNFFRSYAKGNATEVSDVGLLISALVSGMRFYDLAETIREVLQKKVDILKCEQLHDNPKPINEVLKDGI